VLADIAAVLCGIEILGDDRWLIGGATPAIGDYV